MEQTTAPRTCTLVADTMHQTIVVILRTLIGDQKDTPRSVTIEDATTVRVPIAS